MSANPRLTNNQIIINICLEKQTTYTYDKQRRVTQITKPSGKTINTTLEVKGTEVKGTGYFLLIF